MEIPINSTDTKVKELMGRVILFAEKLGPFLPTYIHLLVSAIFPIYVGAHASLSAPSSAVKAPKKKENKPHEDDDLSDEDLEIETGKMEAFTPKDAILFPLMAGLTLSSLYILIKWLQDPAILNKILNYYFMQIGVVFGAKFAKDGLTVLRSFYFPTQYSQDGLLYRVNRGRHRYETSGAVAEKKQTHRPSPLPGFLQHLPLPKSLIERIWRLRNFLYARCSLKLYLHKLLKLKMPVDALDVVAVASSVAVIVAFNFFNKPWYLSNILGLAFCYGSSQYMSPTTFWTGNLLLGALFFYDIYFVFFTPIMVTVATKLDIPVKLLFPRPSSPAETAKGAQSLAMLGLGDIVIPGMMISLALRFDLYLHYLRKSKVVDGKTEKATYAPVTGGWGERFWVNKALAGPDIQAKSFPKIYFYAGLVGYFLGMVATLLVMQIANHAQPALLYLVPGVLVSLWGTAAWRGEVKEMWSFTEDIEDDKEKQKDKSELDSKSKKDRDNEGVDLASSTDPAKDEEADTLEETVLVPTSSTSSASDSNTGSDSSKDKLPTPSTDELETTSEEKSKDTANTDADGRHIFLFSIDFPPQLSLDETDEQQDKRKDEESKQNETESSLKEALDGTV